MFRSVRSRKVRAKYRTVIASLLKLINNLVQDFMPTNGVLTRYFNLFPYLSVLRQSSSVIEFALCFIIHCCCLCVENFMNCCHKAN